MRTFVYKRTHKGDPDSNGWFGIEDCMGQCRNFYFDAVIGIGGIGSYAMAQGISGRVNWIGIAPHKMPLLGGRGPLVVFDQFLIFEGAGKDFRTLAPRLAHRLYSLRAKAPRYVFVSDDSDKVERAEVRRILALANDAPPSAGPPYPAGLPTIVPLTHLLTARR